MSARLSRRELLHGAAWAALGVAVGHSDAHASAIRAIRIASAAGDLELTMNALMSQLGFMQALGLEPELLSVTDGTRILGAVVSGSVDISALAGFGQVFPAIEHGAALKILAGGALRPSLALFSAKPRIKTLAALSGKIVGTGSIGALIYQLTVTLLRKYGVSTAGIRFVNIGSSVDVFHAVRIGIVDAGAADAALIGEASRYGVHALEHGNISLELPEYTFQGIWTSDQKISSKRDALVRALAAYGKLFRFVESAAAKEAFQRARRSVYPNVSAADQQAHWNYVQTYKPYAVNLTLTPERLTYMQQLNVQFGIQSKLLPFEQVADMSLARDAVELLQANG